MEISILIPVHNRLDLTRPCLESIWKHAGPAPSTEIVIIDDASSDGTAEYLDSLGDRVSVLKNTQRQCFGRNMNAAAREAQGEYLCLLNNDTLVTAGWLEKMLEVARRHPDIGVVGNKHLWPDSGKVNHAGMVFDAQGVPVHLYPGHDPADPCVNVSRDFQIVTAACWLVPRELFLQLGGFDEGFVNGFEDVDFCLRVREAGKRVYYCHESVIYHYGQSSPGRQLHDQQNGRTFAKKWGGLVRSDLEDYIARDRHAAQSSKPAATQYVRRPRPATDADLHLAINLEGGGAFTWVTAQLALALEEIGVKPSIKPGPISSSIDKFQIERLKGMMARPASPRAHIKWTHFWNAYMNEPISGEVNAEVFVTNYRYGPRSKHELDRWMRHVVMNGYRKLPVSGYCLDALTELGVPASRCGVVPHGYSPEAITSDARDDRFRLHGKVILAIVNSHDVYRLGTDLLFEAYARAFKRTDDVVLVLKDYGQGADQSFIQQRLAQHKDGPRIVHFSEFSSKEDLLALYRGADCFVAPFRGEGFGMKVLDAFAVGVPVVCPNYGGPTDFQLEGTYFPVQHRAAPVGLCADRQQTTLPQFSQWCECDVDDLARQMRAVISNPDEARRRAELGKRHVREHFSWRRAAEMLRDTIDRFAGERKETIRPRVVGAGERMRKASILIPTYNRPDALEKCLHGFQQQTVPADDFEMLIVDDGSNYPVREFVETRRGSLNVRVLGDGINRRQGGARNIGLPQTRGEIIVFTNDDIVPEPGFLAEHLAAHAANPGEEMAVLGYIDWHPDVQVSELMRYITEEGGQQFAFKHISPGSIVPFGFFYTSNVSAKRSLLIEQEELFSPEYTCYGYEDIEFAARLTRQGMKLLYHPAARALHDHPMTDEQVFRRQYNAGRMLTVYTLQHPELVPQEHQRFLEWLDIFQSQLTQHPKLEECLPDLQQSSESLEAWLLSLARAMKGLVTRLPPQAFDNLKTRDWLAHATAQWRGQIGRVWTHLLDLSERSGMADEWLGLKPDEPNPARDYIRLFLATNVWELLEHNNTCATPICPGNKEGRMMRLARRVRRNRWLTPVWDRVTQMPHFPRYRNALLRMIHRLP